MARLFRRSLALSAARPAKSVPTSWRLLILALCAGVAARLSLYTLPAIALVGLFGVWRLLRRQASTQHLEYVADPWSKRRSTLQQWVGFFTGLVLLALFVLFAVQPLSFALAGYTGRDVVLPLGAAAFLLLFVGAMFLDGWKIGRAALATVVASAALAAGIGLMQPAGDAASVGGWYNTFGRLLLAFGAAELMSGRFAGRQSSVWNSLRDWPRNITLLMALAMILQSVGTQSESSDWLWWIVLTMVAGATVWLTWRARVPAMADLRWWRKDRRSKPMPRGMAVALAFAPAVGLASTTPWTLWLTTFGLGVAATGMLALNSRLDRPMAKKKPTEPAPAPSLQLAASA